MVKWLALGGLIYAYQIMSTSDTGRAWMQNLTFSKVAELADADRLAEIWIRAWEAKVAQIFVVAAIFKVFARILKNRIARRDAAEARAATAAEAAAAEKIPAAASTKSKKNKRK